MTSAGGYRSVLVVDDDKDIVDTLCDVLELRGWNTFRAFDAESAVSLVMSSAVDWVLMDVRMPRMSGIEALEVIRRGRPGQRVVLMTAFATSAVRDEAERADVPLLKKPFDPAALLALLD